MMIVVHFEKLLYFLSRFHLSRFVFVKRSLYHVCYFIKLIYGPVMQKLIKEKKLMMHKKLIMKKKLMIHMNLFPRKQYLIIIFIQRKTSKSIKSFDIEQ